MSKKGVKIPRCPSCGKKLPKISSDNVIAYATYNFSKRRGKYIPCIEVMEIERPHCPSCDSDIPLEWFNVHVDDHLREISLSGIYKPLIIDLQELPFNTKYAEFAEKIPRTFTIKNDEKDSSDKKEKK